MKKDTQKDYYHIIVPTYQTNLIRQASVCINTQLT